jgi:hypothetical protein
MTPEGKIKFQLKKYLTSIGAYWFMPVQTGWGSRALDFLCCYRGLFFACETKAPGKPMKGFQAVKADEMRAAGAKVFKLDDTEFLELREWINTQDAWALAMRSAASGPFVLPDNRGRAPLD